MENCLFFSDQIWHCCRSLLCMHMGAYGRERYTEIFNILQLENWKNRMFVMTSDLWETTEGYNKVLRAPPGLCEGTLINRQFLRIPLRPTCYSSLNMTKVVTFKLR